MEEIRQVISYLVLHIYIIHPLYKVIWLFLAGFAVWMILSLLAVFWGKMKPWRIVNGTLALLFASVLLFITVGSRGETPHGGVNLLPLHSFYLARTENQEYYRSMLMNVLLFFPLGLTLPFGLAGRKRPVLLSLAIGAALSVCIEALQYFLRIGWTETDDVIMNTLGVLLGSSVFGITRFAERRRDRKNNTRR